MTQNPYQTPKQAEHAPDQASGKYGARRKTINLGCGAVVLAGSGPLFVYNIYSLLTSERDSLYNANFLGWAIMSMVISLGVTYSMWRVWRG